MEGTVEANVLFGHDAIVALNLDLDAQKKAAVLALIDTATGRCPRAVWFDLSVALRVIYYIRIHGYRTRAAVVVESYNSVFIAAAPSCASRDTIQQALTVDRGTEM